MHIYELTQAIAEHMPGYMATRMPNWGVDDTALLNRADGKTTFPNFVILAAINNQVMVLHNRPQFIDRQANVSHARPGYITEKGYILVPPGFTGEQIADMIRKIWPALEHQHRLDLGWVAEREAAAYGYRVPVMLQTEWIRQELERPFGVNRQAYIKQYCT